MDEDKTKTAADNSAPADQPVTTGDSSTAKDGGKTAAKNSVSADQPAAAGDASATTGDSSAAAGDSENGDKRRYGENLRHFRKMALDEMEVEEEYREGALEKLNAGFAKWVAQLRAKREDGGATRENAAQAISRLGDLLRRHPKRLIGGGVVLALVALAALIAPIIPLQLQRSNGFTAIEAGDYQKAFAELSTYMHERPNDREAQYKTAQAALRIGNVKYAASALNNLYQGDLLPGEPELSYHFALANIGDSSVAATALDKLLAAAPDHVGGRLLRGLLLANSPDSFRKAREDMLRVDSAARDSDDEFADIVFLHDYLRRAGVLAFPTPVSLPDLSFEPAPAAALGFDTGWDGHLSEYRASASDFFANDNLSARAIVFLYFTYVLMAQSELAEAESQLKEARASAPDSLTVTEAAALLAARRGDNAAAAELFRQITRSLPGDARSQNNLAVAMWASSPTRDNIAAVVALYDEALKADPDNMFALNNAVYLDVVAGDYAAAADRLAAVADVATAGSPSLALNAALVAALWGGDATRALELLRSPAAGGIAGARRYVAALQARQGDWRAALDSLLAAEAENSNDLSLMIARIDLMRRRGEWRIVYDELRQKTFPNDAFPAHYRLALLALRLGDDVEFQRQLNFFSPPAPAHYLFALRGAESRQQGKAGEAIGFYRQAMDAAPSVKSRQEYALEWAQLALADDTETVAVVLDGLLQKRFHPGLLAVLAHALALSQPTKAPAAIALAEKNGHLWLTQKHVGAALATLGDWERAMPLLRQAQRGLPTDDQTLELIRDGRAAAGDAAAAARADAALAHIRGGVLPKRLTYKIVLPPLAALAKKTQTAVVDGNVSAQQEALIGYEAALADNDDPAVKAQLSRSRATFLAFLERYNEAISDFEKALAIGLADEEEQISALLFYAKILSQVGRAAEAVEAVEKVLQAQPDEPAHSRLRAQYLLDSGDAAAAKETLTALLSRYPTDVESYSLLAEIEYRAEDQDAAVDWLEMLLRVAPNYFPAHKRLSDIHTTRGDEWRARAHLTSYSALSGG